MKKLLVAAIITGFSAGLLCAEQRQQPGQQKLSDLERIQLQGSGGEELGEFEDVVIDMESGAVSFVVVAGKNDERRAVPIASIKVSGSGQNVEMALTADQQKFKQAPSIQPEEVAQLGQEQRARKIFEQFGEDYQAYQQKQREFGSPSQQRQGQPQSQQTQQIEQKLEQGLTQAGAKQQQAQQEAQKLASKFTEEKPDQQQIQKEIEQSLKQAGLDQQKAKQKAQSLSQQIHQQIQSGSQERQGQQQQSGGSVKLGQDLTEATVLDQSQEEIGKVSDLLIDMDQGYVSFALIESQDGQEQYAVSPRALEEKQQDQLSLNISSSDLQQAQTLSQQEVQSQAQKQQQLGTAEIRQSPEVFRYQQEGTNIFGTPDREQKQQK